MGFTRAWFGHRSDRIPISRLRRTPFIISSTVAIALLFGVACQLVLRLAASMEDSGGELNALLMGLLILVFVGIGTAIAAGGTAFSALIADRTTEAERPRVLAGLERLSLVTPLLLLGLGVVSVFGVERRTTGLMLTAGPVPPMSLSGWLCPSCCSNCAPSPRPAASSGCCACSPSACSSTMRCLSPTAPQSLE